LPYQELGGGPNWTRKAQGMLRKRTIAAILKTRKRKKEASNVKKKKQMKLRGNRATSEIRGVR